MNEKTEPGKDSVSKIVANNPKGKKFHDGIAAAGLWFGGVIIIAVLVLSAVGFLWWRSERASQETSSSPERPLTTYEKADIVAANGNYDEAQRLLETELNTKSTTADQVTVYLDMSSLALNSNKLDESLAFAQKAEQLSPSRISASMIAQIAEAKGDKVLALQYYKLVLERFTPEEKKELGQADYAAYEQKVKELQ